MTRSRSSVRLLLPLLLAASAALAAPSPVRPFSDYEVILRRAPFGAAPAPDAAEAERVVPIQESFAAQMVLSGIFEDKSDAAMVEVAITDRRDNSYFTLKIGETSDDGVTLLEADYEAEEAILKKGSEVVVLGMKGNPGQVLSQSAIESRRSEMETKRLSYAERRRLRLEARKKPNELPKPIYTGKELEQKLQESQMESIRKGMPPLPVTLTPENDAILVAEGFLPPQDDEGYELIDAPAQPPFDDGYEDEPYYDEYGDYADDY